MKTLVLALLIPVAFCAACSKKEEPVATPAPAAVDTAANPPATAPAMAPAAKAAPAPAIAHVHLMAAAGSAVKGDLTVSNEGDAISIRGEISGLEPGSEHGFHVHEFGKCELPDFNSAGAHFNPTNVPHGEHLGDLPNVKADENGSANVDVYVRGPNLVDKDGAPSKILGKSLVLHAMPDDRKTQPSGASGARIACGVIR